MSETKTNNTTNATKEEKKRDTILTDDNGNETIIINAVIRSAYTKTREGKTSNIITFTTNKKVWDIFSKLFEDTAPKWVPTWFKNRTNDPTTDTAKVRSSFNIPVLIVDDGNRLSFTEYVDRGLIRGAVCEILCNIKDKTVYPSAVQIFEDGEEYDAFAGF